MKRIVCYGDSNTWGYNPDGGRYDADVRWTGVMQQALGSDGYLVLEEGLGGRTTAHDSDYNEWYNGLKGLGYTLLSKAPIDLVICMLGTNDLHQHHAYHFYKGLRMLAYHLKNANIIYPCPIPIYAPTEGPKVLLVSPILIGEGYGEKKDSFIGGKYIESHEFSRYTSMIAQEFDLPWMDAALHAEPSHKDSLHMEADSHRRLGLAIAGQVKALFTVPEATIDKNLRS